MRYGRVLIADDDDTIRRLVERVLDRAAVPYDSVRDGRAAIDHLEIRDYTVLLVDLMMPQINGYELLDYLKRRPRRPPCVLVLTAAGDADIRRLDADVVTMIVRKPFDIHELVNLIRAGAERVRSENETSPPDRLESPRESSRPNS